jgi:hypothetical protein
MEGSNPVSTPWIFGGYYLIGGCRRPAWMDSSLLPEVLWSASENISPKYPDDWVFYWTHQRAQEEQMAARLRLTQAQFEELQREFDEYLLAGRFGYPNVYLAIDLARQFAARYLGHLTDIRLISIALPEPFVDEFLRECAPPPGVAEGGVYLTLKRRQPEPDGGIILGYEVLGFDGADFASYFYGGIEKDFYERLGISYNPYGLIDSSELALAGAELLRSGEIVPEKGYWAVWRMMEYPL